MKMSMSPSTPPATSIRSDTAARHHRKYHSRNPIHRFGLDRFFAALSTELAPLTALHALDFGCGEGFFLDRLRNRGIVFQDLLGLDLRPDAVEQAARLHPDYRFACLDLMSPDLPPASFDLVIASQVLEHLPDPEPCLRRLVELSRDWILLTVPREPYFQLLNLARGRDIMRLGNHPEHLQRWTFRAFTRFVASHATIVRAYTVLTYTIILARKSPPQSD